MLVSILSNGRLHAYGILQTTLRMLSLCVLCVHVITSLRYTDTDARDKDNGTLLHYACMGGRILVVQYLVEVCKVDVGE